MALLFALVDFSDRHHDRHTQVGTDIACVWDRPRISSQPMEIDDISLRIDDDEPSHKEPTQANFDPRSSVNVNTPHNVEKLVHKLCRGTGAVFNHILSDSSADSSDEDMLPLSVDEVAKNNRIYHHTVEGTRESHPSVHDLQSTTRLAESWMLQIMDTRMGFPCPFHNVVIDYFFSHAFHF